jgi:hypothetical protein
VASTQEAPKIATDLFSCTLNCRRLRREHLIPALLTLLCSASPNSLQLHPEPLPDWTTLACATAMLVCCCRQPSRVPTSWWLLRFVVFPCLTALERYPYLPFKLDAASSSHFATFFLHPDHLKITRNRVCKYCNLQDLLRALAVARLLPD